MNLIGYEGILNSTVMPSFRALAYNHPSPQQGEDPGLLGYIDFETDDGYVLLAIFFGLQIIMLWNACLCWSAGSIGLDMVNDAESIVSAKGG